MIIDKNMLSAGNTLMIRNDSINCVGAISRSPMAEVLLRAALGGQIDITVESAGLGALVGYLQQRPMRWT